VRAGKLPAVIFCKTLSRYSNAQRIAMLGFGAQLQDGIVSNCFSLNGRAHHPRCDGAAAASFPQCFFVTN